jgi:hypothetical protein
VLKLLRGAAALAVFAIVLAPTAVHAERWSGGDPRGDVAGWHYEPEPAPCGISTEVDGSTNTNEDITRLVVRHTRTEVRLIARFRDLDPALEQGISFHIATKARRGWFLHIDRFWDRRSDRFRVMGFLAKEPNYPDPEDLDECGGFAFLSVVLPCRTSPRVDLDANEVRTAVPRSCLKNPRWVRVGTSAHGWIAPEDPADPSGDSFSDEWGVRDDSMSIWLPPFGPKVRAAPGAQLAAPARAAAGPSAEPRTRHFVIPSRPR